MTAQQYQQQQQLARRRKKQREQHLAILTVLGIVLLIFALGVLFGWHLGTAHAVTVEPAQETYTSKQAENQAAPENYKATVEPAVIPAIHKTVNHIVSEGNALSPELQKVMQEKCEEYGVPYALALAVADQESRFDPDAKSGTDDHGLMQINSINFEWLREKGIEPLTYEGNIEAGVLILSKALNRYGEMELALMAYNCGDTGAKRLWNAGTYSTQYSRSVMERYNKWVQVLEGE